MKSILIVDDEENIRETLKDVLEDEGYAVFLAENGKVALRILDTHVLAFRGASHSGYGLTPSGRRDYHATNPDEGTLLRPGEGHQLQF